jgi:large repetitive protein
MYQTSRFPIQWLLWLAGWFASISGHAQSGLCGQDVPYFYADLTGQPNGTWLSPAIVRNGLCCGVNTPNTCVEFIVTLDPGAVGLNFQIASGAVPGGAMFYQIGCGPQIPVGQPICISGVGPHIITFCKPGNNNNTYEITSIGPPLPAMDILSGPLCNNFFTVTGLIDSTITWNSITGAPGAYNSYLSCTVGCTTTYIQAGSNPPPYVDFVVCGMPAAPCLTTVLCDTVRVVFIPELVLAVGPQPAIFCEADGGITLTAVAGGGAPAYTYTWTQGGVTLGTSSTFYATAGGQFQVMVQDQSFPGCPSMTQTITVIMDSQAGVSVENVQHCGPGPVQLVANSSGVPVLWSGASGSFIPNANTLNAQYLPSASELAAGGVQLTLTGLAPGSCPTTSAVAILSLNPLPVVSISGPDELCAGSTSELEANVTSGTGPFSYFWNLGEQNSTITITSGGTYSVLVSDAANCSGSASADVALVTSSIAYTLNAADVSCFGAADGSITIIPAGDPGTQNVFWTHGASGSSLTNLAAGTYNFEITDEEDCSLTGSVTINEPAELTLLAVQQNISCAGASDGFAGVQVSGGVAAYTYTWNGVNSLGPAANNLPTGNYGVTVTDQNGCSASAAFVITEPAPLEVVENVVDVLCHGEDSGSIQLAASGGSPTYSYVWTPPTAGGDQLGDLAAGTYSYVITDQNGCTLAGTLTVEQPALPVIPMIISVGTVQQGTEVLLQATTNQGTDGFTFIWGQGLGSGPTILVSPEQTTRYDLLVVDGNGCTYSTSITVFVIPEFQVYIPNSFTPDGDGINDMFQVVGVGFTEFELLVYDRWGELIFTSNRPGMGWDGTVKGREAKTDVYVYRFTVQDPKGDTLTYMGHIGLWR